MLSRGRPSCLPAATSGHYYVEWLRRISTRLLRLVFVGGLCAKAGLAFENFRRGISAEIFRFEDAADFDFRAAIKGRALEPFDRFVHGADLPEPEAGDELFGFGEGAVDHGTLFAFKFDTLAFRRGLKAFAGEHH